MIVDLAHNEHACQTDDGEQGLPLEVVGAVAGVVIGAGKAGGEQHNESDHRQQQRQDQEGQIHGPLGGLRVLLLCLAHAGLHGLLGLIFCTGHGCPSFRNFMLVLPHELHEERKPAS